MVFGDLSFGLVLARCREKKWGLVPRISAPLLPTIGCNTCSSLLSRTGLRCLVRLLLSARPKQACRASAQRTEVFIMRI
jgi:hypothetical protein